MDQKDISSIRESLCNISKLIYLCDEGNLFDDESHSAEMSIIRIQAILEARELEYKKDQISNGTLLLEVSLCCHFGDYENCKVYLKENLDITIFINNSEARTDKHNELIIKIIQNAIDIDSWKHSMHINVSNFKEKEIYNRIIEILKEKQKERKRDLKFLIGVEKLLEQTLK